MTSHLVPTLIVDKNGRLTTVHRRDERMLKGSTPIPAPVTAVQSQPSKSKLVAALADAMDDELLLDEPEQKDYLIENLEVHDVDFLVKLEREMNNGNKFVPATLVNDGETRQFINEVLHFLSYGDEMTFPEFCSVVRSLHHYPQLPEHDDYSEAPESVQKQCIALMETVSAVLGNVDDTRGVFTKVIVPDREDAFLLADEALAKAVIGYPDEAPRIIEAIREHRTARFAVIDALLNEDQSPLVDGVL